MRIKKGEPKKTFTSLFDIILTAEKNESHEAASEVRKLLYKGNYDKKTYREIYSIVEDAPNKYVKIIEEWREENFVRAISVMHFSYVWHKQPNILFPWLFFLLTHKNGNVRNSARRMIENSLAPLTTHLRGDFFKHTDKKIKEFNSILFAIYYDLNLLLDSTWEPKYERYKYVDSLPTSPYKTVQMVLCAFKRICGKDFTKQVQKELNELFRK